MTLVRLLEMSHPIKNRIDFLDFMRIFAFLSVLIGHKFFSSTFCTG